LEALPLTSRKRGKGFHSCKKEERGEAVCEKKERDGTITRSFPRGVPFCLACRLGRRGRSRNTIEGRQPSIQKLTVFRVKVEGGRAYQNDQDARSPKSRFRLGLVSRKGKGRGKGVVGGKERALDRTFSFSSTNREGEGKEDLHVKKQPNGRTERSGV